MIPLLSFPNTTALSLPLVTALNTLATQPLVLVKMFVYRKKNLPPDPEYPPELKKLG
jgi:hypothetical protein